jgi:hypothetical protein
MLRFRASEDSSKYTQSNLDNRAKSRSFTLRLDSGEAGEGFSSGVGVGVGAAT